MARALLTLFSLLLLAYLAAPLVIVVGASLTTAEFLSFPPAGLTLKWFSRVFDDASYLSAFGTSTALAVCATLVALLLALPASLAVTRHPFPGRRAVEGLFMSALVLPYLVLGAALLQFGTVIGLVRSFPALLVGHVVIVTPFVMRSILPQLGGEERALEEASRDLGAGPFATFMLVTVPHIRGGIVSGTVLAFITSWINVELSIFNTTPALTTIPVKLFNYIQYTIDPSIAAVSAITILVAAGTIIALDAIFGLDIVPTSKKGE